MKLIQLTQGEYAIVDDEDFKLLSHWKWHLLKKKTNKYAVRRNPKGKPKNILMHRQILYTRKDQYSDHINGNGLDNRRSNLRLCTHTESNRYVQKRSHNTSGYLGVYNHEGKWAAGIRVSSKHIYLGRYRTKEEAALAYNVAAIKYHGQFATLNFL